METKVRHFQTQWTRLLSNAITSDLKACERMCVNEFEVVFARIKFNVYESDYNDEV